MWNTNQIYNLNEASMTEKEFLEERTSQAKQALSYLVREYQGEDKDRLIDMLLDSINEAKSKLKEM